MVEATNPTSIARYANEEPDFSGQCAATAKHSGARCRRHAVKGRAVCQVHGGTSPSGVAHPSFKHGRNSKALGKYTVDGALGEVYAEIRENREALLEGWDEIALTAARVQVLLGEVGESPGAVNAELFKAWRAFKSAMDGKNAAKIRETFATLSDAFDEARQHDGVLNELWDLVDLMRRIRATETRRIATEKDTMNAQQARAFLANIQTVMIEVFAQISDADERAAARNAFVTQMRAALAVPIAG